MKYFSLFSGIGGFEYGIKKADNNSTKQQKTQSERWRKNKKEVSNGNSSKPASPRRTNTTVLCVGYSEIDKYAEAIYRFHYPEQENYGDATRIIPEEIPDFDLLCGGFPCQAFSIAGKRKGFDDTRGTLFFEICRILGIKRPDYFLLENVRGLLSHNEGRTFLVVLQSLDELGYDLQWQVLNSKDWGVPQNRERVFIIGHIRGKPRPEVFPIKEENSLNAQESNREQGEKPWVSTIDSRYGERWSTETYVRLPKRLMGIFDKNKKQHQAGSIYATDGIAPMLDTAQGGYREPLIIPCLDANDNRKMGSGQSKRFFEKTNMIRRLTPIECERLQGFPDNWTKWGIVDGKKVEISDTQRYKCLGNAVTTNVIERIMSNFNV